MIKYCTYTMLLRLTVLVAVNCCNMSTFANVYRRMREARSNVDKTDKAMGIGEVDFSQYQELSQPSTAYLTNNHYQQKH